jgi:hypothetical protein
MLEDNQNNNNCFFSGELRTYVKHAIVHLLVMKVSNEKQSNGLLNYQIDNRV